jgi:hypothetical protein
MGRLIRRKTLSGTPEELLAAIRELPPGHRYHVEIVRLDPPSDPNAAMEEAIQKMNARTPEQLEADRSEILHSSRKPRELPPGKTLDDVMREFREQFPPTETDEEVEDALEEMS